MPGTVKYRGCAAAMCRKDRGDHDLASTDLHHPRRARRHPAFRHNALWRTPGDRHPRRPGRGAAASGPHFARRGLANRAAGRITDLEARYAIETDRGTRVLVRSDGLRHGPPEVIAALARGEAVEPSRYYFRTVMRFETADPALAWLNRILALGTGAREKLAVRLDVYEVV